MASQSVELASDATHPSILADMLCHVRFSENELECSKEISRNILEGVDDDTHCGSGYCKLAWEEMLVAFAKASYARLSDKSPKDFPLGVNDLAPVSCGAWPVYALSRHPRAEQLLRELRICRGCLSKLLIQGLGRMPASARAALMKPRKMLQDVDTMLQSLQGIK